MYIYIYIVSTLLRSVIYVPLLLLGKNATPKVKYYHVNKKVTVQKIKEKNIVVLKKKKWSHMINLLSDEINNCCLFCAEI